jgi:[protein-PII] uridylyltransferase
MMLNLIEIKESFISSRENLLKNFNEDSDPLEFSKSYSILIENTIKEICSGKNLNFAIASSGSFARRELSPYSDVDIMFITNSVNNVNDQINSLVADFYDCGLELSYIVREVSDAKKFLESDLQSFTQLTETKYIYGDNKIYDSLITNIFELIKNSDKKKLLEDFKTALEQRYKRYGNSPKFLEPNIKMTAGGLRDLQYVQWMYLILNEKFHLQQNDLFESENLLTELIKDDFCTFTEGKRIYNSYKFLLKVRHFLHLLTKRKTDRLEIDYQIKIANKFPQFENHISFMKNYFNSTNCIYRFSRSCLKKFSFNVIEYIPDSLAYDIDDDFYIKGKVLYSSNPENLQFSDFLRAFYYKGLHSVVFDNKLRSIIIDRISNQHFDLIETGSSVFFREILKLPKNVGETLYAMNELGVLGAFLPEFEELNGFMQVGVYHCFTADEHTLNAIRNLEKLYNDNSKLGILFKQLQKKEILYLAILFHDIAKPISIPGHEILGAEIASSVMSRLGYNDNEIDLVCFLVRNHLYMEQVAFRRNLNDPLTLNNFAKLVDSFEKIDLLYLITYADLSAVNSAVWTNWKAQLLDELYLKVRKMLHENITGEQLLYSAILTNADNITQHSINITESNVQEHINSLHDDVSYISHFSDEEIAKHIEEIEAGKDISVLFDEKGEFTHITIITSDHTALLSKICGVFAINDLTILDARIFTRKDGIVIDSFNVLDFKTHSKVPKEKYQKLEEDFHKILSEYINLPVEVKNLKSKWKRLEKKLFPRDKEIKISFEEHNKYTIIDVSAPDRLGFLYHITKEMSELGLIIYFAKISTKGDNILDAFYVLNRFGQKISPIDYELIRIRLTEAINRIL